MLANHQHQWKTRCTCYVSFFLKSRPFEVCEIEANGKFYLNIPGFFIFNDEVSVQAVSRKGGLEILSGGLATEILDRDKSPLSDEH